MSYFNRQITLHFEYLSHPVFPKQSLLPAAYRRVYVEIIITCVSSLATCSLIKPLYPLDALGASKITGAAALGNQYSRFHQDLPSNCLEWRSFRENH